MASQLYYGQVMHQRFMPVNYQFRYGVLSLKFDIDQIEQQSQQVKGFSFNGFNLFSINQEDYGAREKTISWRQWADQLLNDYGLQQPAARIELVCFPRFLGYQFNPLAIWYAYNHNSELVAIICEVSNTFGQWHHYVLVLEGKNVSSKIRAQASKCFHVSPFIDMDASYEFRFSKPDQTYQLAIFEKSQGKPLLTATQVAKAKTFDSQTIFKSALRFPFNGLKVMFLIHWWALKIWFKGGSFHKTPAELAQLKHTHSEMVLC